LAVMPCQLDVALEQAHRECYEIVEVDPVPERHDLLVGRERLRDFSARDRLAALRLGDEAQQARDLAWRKSQRLAECRGALHLAGDAEAAMEAGGTAML